MAVNGKMAVKNATIGVGVEILNRPQGTILKKAYVNLTRIKESLGDAYDTMYTNLDTIKTALPMIVFEEDLGE